VKKRRKRRYRKSSVEFKVSAVVRMLSGENVRALSRILEVSRSQLYRWLEQYREQAHLALQFGDSLRGLL
jgi:transposase-like protein